MDSGITPAPAFEYPPEFRYLKDLEDKVLRFICKCEVYGINRDKAVKYLQRKLNIKPVWTLAAWEKIRSQQNRNAAAIRPKNTPNAASPSLQQQQQDPPRFTNPLPYIPPDPAPRPQKPDIPPAPAPRPKKTAAPQRRCLRSDTGASPSRHQPQPRLHQFGDTATPSFSSAMQGAMRPHQQNVDDNALFQQPAAYLPDLNLPASSASAMQQYEQPPQNVEGQGSPFDDCIDWLFSQPLLDDETLDLLSAFLWDDDVVGTSSSASAPMQQSNPNAAATPPIPNQQSDPNAAGTPPIPNQQSDPNAAGTPPIPHQQSDPNAAETPPIPHQQSDPNAAETPPIPNQQSDPNAAETPPIPHQQSDPNAAETPPIPNQQPDPNAAATPPIPNQQSDPNAAETPPIPNQLPPAQP